MEKIKCLEKYKFEKGELVLFSGDVSIGKSSFLRRIAMDKAKEGEKIKFFTGEDSAQKMIDKIVAMEGHFEYGEKKDGDTLAKIQPFLCNLDICTDTKYECMVKALNSFRDGFVVIDGLKNVYSAVTGQDLDGLWDMAATLKRIAVENSLEIWVTVPLSRDIQKKAGRRPSLDMILDAGTFQNVCDKIVFLVRREHYDINDKPGQAELVVSKNRNGVTGSEKLCFVRQSMAFENFVPLESFFEGEADFSSFSKM